MSVQLLAIHTLLAHSSYICPQFSPILCQNALVCVWFVGVYAFAWQRILLWNLALRSDMARLDKIVTSVPTTEFNVTTRTTTSNTDHNRAQPFPVRPVTILQSAVSLPNLLTQTQHIPFSSIFLHCPVWQSNWCTEVPSRATAAGSPVWPRPWRSADLSSTNEWYILTQAQPKHASLGKSRQNPHHLELNSRRPSLRLPKTQSPRPLSHCI